jgi:hypothetical protein
MISVTVKSINLDPYHVALDFPLVAHLVGNACGKFGSFDEAHTGDAGNRERKHSDPLLGIVT